MMSEMGKETRPICMIGKGVYRETLPSHSDAEREGENTYHTPLMRGDSKIMY
jgi:hypothetical protein